MSVSRRLGFGAPQVPFSISLVSDAKMARRRGTTRLGMGIPLSSP
jgi:hypothetical protein